MSYSNAVSLDFGGCVTESNTNNNNISIYPNPSNGIINLAISQNSNNNSPKQATTVTTQSFAAVATTSGTAIDIKIININGRVLQEGSSATPNWQSNVSALLPGTYIIQVLNTSDKKLVGKSTFVKL